MICSICTEFCDDDVITRCGHKFHPICLINWMEINNSCPNCRLYDPLDKQFYLKSKICGCGSCTALFLPTKIDIWICNDIIPLCPYCYIDIVFPFPEDFPMDRIMEFLKSKNRRLFGGVININTIVKIKDDVVVIVNGNNEVLTHFFRSQSFNEYFELS